MTLFKTLSYPFWRQPQPRQPIAFLRRARGKSYGSRARWRWRRGQVPVPEAQAEDLAGPVQYLRAVSKPPRSECSSLLRRGTAMNKGKSARVSKWVWWDIDWYFLAQRRGWLIRSVKFWDVRYHWISKSLVRNRYVIIWKSSRPAMARPLVREFTYQLKGNPGRVDNYYCGAEEP